MSYHLERSAQADPTIRAIKHAVGYSGYRVRLSTEVPKELRSYWSGGSRDFFLLYGLETGKVFQLPSNHPFFEPSAPSSLRELKQGVALIKRTYFQGKDLGITIYARAEDLAPLLPEKHNLTLEERIVLAATRAYKNSYGGETNLRYKESYRAGFEISFEEWQRIQDTLRAKKLLNKAGAITPTGRNAIGSEDHWSLCREWKERHENG